MHPSADELTVIEGGKSRKESPEHPASSTIARTSGGLLITSGNGHGVGIVWPQVLGVLPSGPHTLAIVASFCLVTLHGSGVAALARIILDRRISELREGMEMDGARIDRIVIESNVPPNMLPEGLSTN